MYNQIHLLHRFFSLKDVVKHKKCSIFLTLTLYKSTAVFKFTLISNRVFLFVLGFDSKYSRSFFHVSRQCTFQVAPKFHKNALRNQIACLSAGRTHHLLQLNLQHHKIFMTHYFQHCVRHQNVCSIIHMNFFTSQSNSIVMLYLSI